MRGDPVWNHLSRRLGRRSRSRVAEQRRLWSNDERDAQRDRARLPGLDALDWVVGRDPQSHVKHDATVCHASDGVEVSLDDLGDLAEQEREAQDQLAQRLAIEHGAAAEPVELVTTPLARSISSSASASVTGSRRNAAALAKAGLATAEAERQHRAEIGIADGPDQYVRPAGRDQALDDRSDPFPSGGVYASFELAPTGSYRRTRPSPRAAQRRCRSHARGGESPPSARPERRFRAPPRPLARARGSDARRATGIPCVASRASASGERKPAACGLAIKK